MPNPLNRMSKFYIVCVISMSHALISYRMRISYIACVDFMYIKCKIRYVINYLITCVNYKPCVLFIYRMC